MYYSFIVPSGCWPFTNPLVPATPLTTLPQLSPLSGFVTPNTASSVGYLSQFPYAPTAQSTPNPHYFQWPPLHSAPEIVPSNHNPCYKMMDSSSSSSTGANLPDFDTVFTTLSN